MSKEKQLTVQEKLNTKFESLDDLITYLTIADEGEEESTRGQIKEVVADLADIIAHNKDAMTIFSKYMGSKVGK